MKEGGLKAESLYLSVIEVLDGFYLFTLVADSPFQKILKYQLFYYESAVVEFMEIT